MHKLEIPVYNIPLLPGAEDILPYFNQLESVPIGNNPWPAYENFVKASFKIAHNGNAIFLKYDIEEDYLTASSATNGDIHNDSCVEFFISFDENENYYNLEFNSLGWAKIGYGSDRDNRLLLPSPVVDLVSSSSTINTSVIHSQKLFRWNIVLVIPLAVFSYSDIHSLNGVKARGNFYKCGDEMPKPHFLTWRPVETAEPDFHKKEFFGQFEFA